MTDGGADILDVDLEAGIPTTDVDPETLRSGLDSDRASVRTHAATIAAGLARRDLETVRAVVPALVDRLDDDQRVVVYQSAVSLSVVAEDDPAHLVDAVPALVDLLGHDLPVVRTLAARMLGYVVVDRPGPVTDHAGALVSATVAEPSDVLDAAAIEDAVDNRDGRRSLQDVNREARTQQSHARAVTANVLVEVAEHDPAAVRPHADAIADLLGADDERILLAATDLLGTIGAADSAAVAAAVEPLCGLLEHDSDEVVAGAVRALGYAGDPAAVEPLRGLAADADRPAALRDLAADTATFLDT